MRSAVILATVGCALLFVSWGPLHNVFEEYQDSEPVAYVLFALPFLLGALVCFALAARAAARAMRDD